MRPARKALKIMGDATLLAALALSPVAMAQDDALTREERLAERHTQIDARRQRQAERAEQLPERQREELAQRQERLMAHRNGQAGENGVNPRRRDWDAGSGPGPGEFARRRWNAANTGASMPGEYARRRWNAANPAMPGRAQRPMMPPARGGQR